MAEQSPMEQIAKELIAIKRLIAFKLMQDGLSQTQLADALGMAQSSVSRMFSTVTPQKRSRGKKQETNNGADEG